MHNCDSAKVACGDKCDSVNCKTTALIVKKLNVLTKIVKTKNKEGADYE